MAIDATPYEVWIEWRTRPRAAVVVPYVRAQSKGLLEYQVIIRREGSSGFTEIQQTGDVQLQPSIPKSLGELLISRDPGDTCTVQVRLGDRDKPKPALERSFDCPLVR